MKFLNKKERVFDIQLTQYGKHLLSTGEFKPVYYAFFDNDVIYDSRYGGFTEDQNNAQTRIKEGLQFEAPYMFNSAEQAMNASNASSYGVEFNQVGYGNLESQMPRPEILRNMMSPFLQPTPTKEYAASYAMGSANLGSQQTAGWSVNSLQGFISGSTQFYTGSGYTSSIPQMNMLPISYKTQVQKESSEPLNTHNSFTTPTFDDNRYIRVYEDSVIIEVDEFNSPFENENFEIEVFEVEEIFPAGQTSTSPTFFQKLENLTPLYFEKPPQYIKNNILLDEPEYPSLSEIDSSYVEHYFNINVDHEINQKLLCELGPEDKAQGIFSSRMLNCQESNEQERMSNKDLYSSDVSEDDIEDDC